MKEEQDVIFGRKGEKRERFLLLTIILLIVLSVLLRLCGCATVDGFRHDIHKLTEPPRSIER